MGDLCSHCGSIEHDIDSCPERQGRQPVSDEEIQRLADEAEAGYSPAVLAAQRQPPPDSPHEFSRPARLNYLGRSYALDVNPHMDFRGLPVQPVEETPAEPTPEFFVANRHDYLKGRQLTREIEDADLRRELRDVIKRLYVRAAIALRSDGTLTPRTGYTQEQEFQALSDEFFAVEDDRDRLAEELRQLKEHKRDASE